MKKSILFIFLLFSQLSHSQARAKTEKNWLIGINLPIPSFESNIGDHPFGSPINQFIGPHHVLRPGISLAYKGITANFYYVGINPFMADNPDNTDYYAQASLYTPTTPFRYNIGYQYCFGAEEASRFKPLVGLYYGYQLRTNLEFASGFRYGSSQFLVGVYMESNRHIVPLSDRWMDTSVNLKYQYRFDLPSRAAGEALWQSTREWIDGGLSRLRSLNPWQ